MTTSPSATRIVGWVAVVAIVVSLVMAAVAPVMGPARRSEACSEPGREPSEVFSLEEVAAAPTSWRVYNHRGKTGSSIPVSEKHVVTAAHVVAGAGPGEISVSGAGGKELTGCIVWSDPKLDAAVVYVPAGRYSRVLVEGAGDVEQIVSNPDGSEVQKSSKVTPLSDVVDPKTRWAPGSCFVAGKVVPGMSGGGMYDSKGRARCMVVDRVEGTYGDGKSWMGGVGIPLSTVKEHYSRNWGAR